MDELINRLYILFFNRHNMPKAHRKPYNKGQVNQIRNDIINLSTEIKNIYPHYSSELFVLKDSLIISKFDNYYNDYVYFFHNEAFASIFTILKALKHDIDDGNSVGFWIYIHPMIIGVSQQLFIDTHYAKAVQAAFVEINTRVKKIRKQVDGTELDGDSLMRQTFSVNKPFLSFEDNTTESGRNVQQGYMDIFAGVMKGIRNPNAHENIIADKNDAVRKLMLASLLMYKLDDGVSFSQITEIK